MMGSESGFNSGESITIPVESITMLLSIAMLPSPVSWHSAVYVELGLKQNLVSRPVNGSPSIVSFMYTQLSLQKSGTVSMDSMYSVSRK